MQPRTERIGEVRFAPTQESLTLMKELKKFFLELQEKMPDVRGLSFFGSRVIGRERGMASDLDTVVFCDTSRYKMLRLDEEDLLKFIYEHLDKSAFERFWLFLKGQTPLQRVEQEQKQSLRMLDDLRRLFIQQMKELGLPIVDNETPAGNTILLRDLSQKVTDKTLQDFAHEIFSLQREHRINFDDPEAFVRIDHFSRSGFDLCSRFFLAVGSDVYKNRQYILDTLEKTPRGREVFKAIMCFLQRLERTRSVPGKPPLTPYPHYPKTIEEARRYFLT